MNIKNLVNLILSFFILYFICPVWAATTKDIAGTYELTGVMEMAGAIRLMPDQRYEAQFSYGAADWIEEGSWKLVGDNSVVLSGAKFKARNTMNLPLFLPNGTRFIYKQGKLTAYGANGGHVTFINPNKTPSTASAPGEGRMRVSGAVIKIDSETLEVKTAKECMYFNVNQLSSQVIQAAKKSRHIDVEIPYSAIVAGGGC